MEKPTIYTVKVWFKDPKGGEHENEFQFHTADVANEFAFKTKVALAKLYRRKAILLHIVTVTPCFPARYTTT